MIVTNVGRDAVDAMARDRRTALFADGEVVWSRRPDAGVKSFEKQTLLPSERKCVRPGGNGGKKARSPRRARYKS
jgi:hypothetical protein